ncbi:MAG TPA: DUF2863 family protein [Rhodocyclaceae bacterium]|nr:DUF2863 family protein [Rhodocyclaceae bacterium]
MKRIRPLRSTRATPDQQALMRDARALGFSGSRLEDAFWEARLTRQIDALLKSGDEDALNSALEQLYQGNDRGYESLIDLMESRAESHSTEKGGNLLLIALPVLAWSRFSIPSGPIRKEVMTNLRVQLQAHVLAADVKLGLADILFSPEQLPFGFCETARFTGRLGHTALHNDDLHLDPGQLPEAMNFLSDIRYVLGVVAFAEGAPAFRWQEDGGNRDQVLRQWQQQGGEALRPLFPGCALETELPTAFFNACRDADRAARPYALRASVAFLNTVLNAAPNELTATMAPFEDDGRLVEYRIGFTQANKPQVVHGVVWPLLDGEDENTDVPAQVEALLKEAGGVQFRYLDNDFPAEYCEDCGVPYYPNPDGEAVHAELPEEQNNAIPRHLH